MNAESRNDIVNPKLARNAVAAARELEMHNTPAASLKGIDELEVVG